MTKLLFYGESPLNETGAARVDRHLLDAIVECGIDVEVLATSHFFEDRYDHTRYPYPITGISEPTEEETHKAAAKAIDARAGSFDWLFVSGDMHVPQLLKEQVMKFPSIVLGAIDGTVPFAEQIDSFTYARVPAVYSKFAYAQVVQALPELVDDLHCIPLGCEPDVFYPLPEEERRAYRLKAFGIDDDNTFLVIWANRNQFRKDPGRALKAFHLFHQRVPNSKLYMHTKVEDMGGNLIAQAKFLGLSRGEVIFPAQAQYEDIGNGQVKVSGYSEIFGFTREKQNLLYNAADVAISTSRGEGWGLTTTELMAAGVPFIGPANTTFFELVGATGAANFTPGTRGYLVKSGGDDLWDIFYGRDDSPRPMVSCDALADCLYYVFTHREEAAVKVDHARQWTKKHTWHEFKQAWKEVLTHEVKSMASHPVSGPGSAGILAVQTL